MKLFSKDFVLKKINNCIIEDATAFVKMWNSAIIMYGIITVREIGIILGLTEFNNYAFEKMYFNQRIDYTMFEQLKHGFRLNFGKELFPIEF